MTQWKDKPPREKRMIFTFLIIGIPCMLMAMLGGALLFGKLFCLGPDDPISLGELIIFMIFMVAAILVGLAIGGWLWLVLARFLFGFTRSEIEGLMAEDPNVPIISTYNSWCLDLIYGRK